MMWYSNTHLPHPPQLQWIGLWEVLECYIYLRISFSTSDDIGLGGRANMSNSRFIEANSHFIQPTNICVLILRSFLS